MASESIIKATIFMKLYRVIFEYDDGPQIQVHQIPTQPIHAGMASYTYPY